jgi:hypothetical protein
MADIFVSYKHCDYHKVAPLVAFLELQGWSVWWDTRLDAGERWDEVIESELASARCIIVAWTRDSIDSRWVRTEATEGLERGILVPLLLDTIKPPVAFKLVNYTDITGWSGSTEAPIARQIIKAVSRFAGQPAGHPQATAATISLDAPEPVRRLYLYISEDKLASLAPEAPLRTTQDKASLIPRLLEGLRRQGLVKPHGPYIEKDMVMKWGLVDFGVCDADFRVALFYNDEERLLLCGSAKHIVGPTSVIYKYPARYFGFSGSNLPGIIKFLSETIGTSRHSFDQMRNADEQRDEFLGKVAPYLVEQRVYFVARLLGEKFGLTIGTPICVALADTVRKHKRQRTRVIDHLKVDAGEIEKRAREHEARKHEQKRRDSLERLINAIRKLSEDASLDAFHRATQLYLRFCNTFAITPIPHDKRDIPVSFSTFLRNPNVIAFVLKDVQGSPFRLDELFYATAESGMQDEAVGLLEEIMKIKYYIPGVDVGNYVASHKIGYLRPVLERWRSHPEPNVRRWVRRALDSIPSETL